MAIFHVNIVKLGKDGHKVTWLDALKNQQQMLACH